MVQTRRGREEVKQDEVTEGRKTRGRNAKVESVKDKQKTPINKVGSPIKKQVSPKKSPIKKLVFTASPGRTTYSSRMKTPTRKEKEKMEMDVDTITDRMDKCVLEMSPPLSQDSAISMGGSLSKSSSSLDSKRDELATPPPTECTNPSSSSSFVTPVVPLRGRENEFNRLLSLIDRSTHKKEPLTIYISGTPGTGKSATTGLVLQLLEQPPRKIKTCMVNCTSVTKGDDLCAAIMRSLEKPCPASTAKSKFTSFVSALKKTLVLVLDEADFVEEKMLTSVFTMPATLSAHLIVIGIANSIDLTERLLRKIKLKLEVERMVFPRYSKEELALIVSHKMKDEIKEGEGLDATGIDLCARKVSAVSGDVREVMSIMRQSCLRSRIERGGKSIKEEEKMDMGTENLPSTPVSVPAVSIRHITEVARLKYSSALSRSTLQLQPGILLALCLKLSAGKKKSLTRGTLFNEYRKASNHKEAKWQMVEGSDLSEAFDMLVSQGHVSVQGDLIRIQVDSKTARESIRDNDVLSSIDLIL